MSDILDAMLWHLIGSLLCGAVGLYVLFTRLLRLSRFLRYGIRARANIVRLTQLDDPDGKLTVPVIEFQDLNGKTIHKTLEWNIYNKRQFVNIIYDPSDPLQLIPDDWTKHQEWIGGLVIIGLAILLATKNNFW